MSNWAHWEITEREMMEAANAAIFYDRPDLQFKFDGSAPPLMPALAAAASGGDVKQAPGETPQSGGALSAVTPNTSRSVP